MEIKVVLGGNESSHGPYLSSSSYQVDLRLCRVFIDKNQARYNDFNLVLLKNMLDLVYIVVIQGKTFEPVICGGIPWLDSKELDRARRKLQALGKLTVLERTMALCSPYLAMASRRV
jgi:hypothetical protein